MLLKSFYPCSHSTAATKIPTWNNCWLFQEATSQHSGHVRGRSAALSKMQQQTGNKHGGSHRKSVLVKSGNTNYHIRHRTQLPQQAARLWSEEMRTAVAVQSSYHHNYHKELNTTKHTAVKTKQTNSAKWNNTSFMSHCPDSIQRKKRVFDYNFQEIKTGKKIIYRTNSLGIKKDSGMNQMN